MQNEKVDIINESRYSKPARQSGGVWRVAKFGKAAEGWNWNEAPSFTTFFPHFLRFYRFQLVSDHLPSSKCMIPPTFYDFLHKHEDLHHFPQLFTSRMPSRWGWPRPPWPRRGRHGGGLWLYLRAAQRDAGRGGHGGAEDDSGLCQVRQGAIRGQPSGAANGAANGASGIQWVCVNRVNGHGILRPMGPEMGTYDMLWFWLLIMLESRDWRGDVRWLGWRF